MTHRYFKIIIGYLITMVSLIYVFKQVEILSFIIALKEINIFCVFESTMLFMFSCIFRVFMWNVTTKMYDSFSFSNLFGGIMMGYLINNILPLKCGELLRAHHLTKNGKISFVAAVSTIFIERIFDVLSLLILVVIAIVYKVNMNLSVSIYPKTIVIVFALAIVTILLYSKSKNKLNSIINQNIKHKFKLFIEPIWGIFNIKSVILLLFFNLGAWFCNFFSISVLLYNLHSNQYVATLTLLLFVSAGLLIPSAPGSFGIIQIAFLAALIPYGLERQHVLSLSFSYQIGILLSTIIMGLPYLIINNWDKKRCIFRIGGKSI